MEKEKGMEDKGFSVCSLACGGFIKVDDFSSSRIRKGGALEYRVTPQHITIYVPH